MDVPNFIPPIPSPHRNDRQLRQNNRTPNSNRNLLRTLHPQTHVPVTITHHHKRLEPGSLTGPGLFPKYNSTTHHRHGSRLCVGSERRCRAQPCSPPETVVLPPYLSSLSL
ncbi:hypothetical protein Hanom_Chr05g00467211 [Helianthus anomalus]